MTDDITNNPTPPQNTVAATTPTDDAAAVQELEAKAKALLADMKSRKDTFKGESDALLATMEKGVQETEKIAADADIDLVKTEKDATDAVNASILDYVAKTTEEEE